MFQLDSHYFVNPMHTSVLSWQGKSSTLEDEKFKEFPLRLIPFNQLELISKLDINKHKALVEINKRFHGLCDIICNCMLIDNVLGGGEDENLIKNHITIERLNEEKIKKSHLFNIYSIFHRIIGYLFGIYPDNIFSICDQWKLIHKTSSRNAKIKLVNRKILDQGLKKISDGETLKLEVFSRIGLTLVGHSLLIKKMHADKYMFFDPNSGEDRNLSFTQLSEKIDKQLLLQRGTDIFLTRGEDFLKRFKKRY